MAENNIATAQDIEGRIRVCVSVDSDRVAAVSIESSRRTNASRILEGRPVDEALRALPLVFSVCGVAQASAGMAACEEARGIVATAAERARRSVLVAAESIQEHAGRLLLDWPKLFIEVEPRFGEIVALCRSMVVLKHALGGEIWQAADGGIPSGPDLKVAGAQLSEIDAVLAHSIFGMPGRDWLRIHDEETLRQWYRHTTTAGARILNAVEDLGLADLGRSSVGTLPPIAASSLAATLDADSSGGFTAFPVWNGRACETGPLARQGGRRLIAGLWRRNGNGLMTRLAARLVELASSTCRMEGCLKVMRSSTVRSPVRGCRMQAAQSGTGIVETARGRLVHRVALRGDSVERYRILAPTEWNFHPEGPLARAVLALPASGTQDLRNHVSMLVVSLDPCVAHEVVIESARSEES
ncbi:MAG: nickel-dependent hydrogenase large subunit [Acidiferrobacterales bacterium]